MRHIILTVMSVLCDAGFADDSTLAKRLDRSDLDNASHVFSRVIDAGNRNEWDQLHRYFIHNPERYTKILERVANLPKCGPDDVFVFYFGGNVTEVPSTDSTSEQVASIVAYDFKSNQFSTLELLEDIKKGLLRIVCAKAC